MSVERFIRFEDEKGSILYGEVSTSDLKGSLEGKSVSILTGDPFTGLSKTTHKSVIKKLLCPLEATPIVIGIGLNYARHAKEANLFPSSFPAVFTKPADALAGPYDDISIHPDAQSQLDYEGELTVIIGKDAKNVTEADALDYVLGYTAGNDVSARNFQLPVSVSGSQFSYAKSFDKFAPIGPSVLLAKGVDPHRLSYVTKVNGDKRQETGTDDMIFSIKQIVAHLSRGTTLRKGTVIMTGTPSGVGLFMEPKGFLKDGDVVEVDVEGIGSLRNRIVFEKA
ncbi:fumarylacetoacetate hydrolase family protein [Mollisia scopiformis]|uniref:Fumarylacetoacetate hydrolase family protein n=1 Tax=Mollisia scopiformis TaxID=149040 RepID=A0A194X0V6_MOLSC|nr:fumarylacetoacetate hydrolase family protein [Mollisia scopiformis]KUJ13599.1 fumarylacetoacetate hydrolase family protein [Mollisia scopiformis]